MGGVGKDYGDRRSTLRWCVDVRSMLVGLKPGRAAVKCRDSSSENFLQGIDERTLTSAIFSKEKHRLAEEYERSLARDAAEVLDVEMVNPGHSLEHHRV